MWAGQIQGMGGDMGGERVVCGRGMGGDMAECGRGHGRVHKSILTPLLMIYYGSNPKCLPQTALICVCTGKYRPRAI